jgi:hypothetical protein
MEIMAGGYVFSGSYCADHNGMVLRVFKRIIVPNEKGIKCSARIREIDS